MRFFPIAVAAGLVWPHLANAQAQAQARPPTPEAVPSFRILDALDPCRGASRPDEVVVCGRRVDPNRYRLPLPGAGRAPLGTGYVRGEVPRATAETNVSDPCGIFAGQRRCNEAEMAEFGYERGRDPISFIGNIVAGLVDPEADMEVGPSRPR